MRGRLPKDPALRQRRNHTVGAMLSPESDAKRRVPSLPKRYVTVAAEEGGEPTQTLRPWHKLTVAWWRDVWRSPMAAEYLQADVHALYRLAVLVDAFWVTPTRELAAEIRLQQQCFGLTPIDRRRLQWEVERVEAVIARQPVVQPAHPEAQDDPRKLLSVVS